MFLAKLIAGDECDDRATSKFLTNNSQNSVDSGSDTLIAIRNLEHQDEKIRR